MQNVIGSSVLENVPPLVLQLTEIALGGSFCGINLHSPVFDEPLEKKEPRIQPRAEAGKTLGHAAQPREMKGSVVYWMQLIDC